ncbi:MAG: glycosyltransferase family 4 protein [Desulfitobacteriaceae bacterium]|nr:glycosyltransferase family 4 protein [Desulfitobacteriaceae bacterium]
MKGEKNVFELEKFREAEFSRREKHLRYAKKQELVESRAKNSQLHIVYVMTHVGICGGTKIIFEHANHIVRFNQRVTIVSHFEKPTWYPISNDVKYIQVPLTQELALGIPQCDVIVATYWREIYECIAREIAPVVYFEQGDYHLFAWEDVCRREKDFIYKQFQLVPFIYTVSKGASKQIKKNFGRDSTIINNAIDNTVFYYDSGNIKDQKKDFALMMIGSENNEFKGIGDIRQALSLLPKSGHDLKLVWVTPDKPIHPTGTVFVNPKQSQIGDLLRKSNIFICGSYYESFSLPVLEAMACGCAVITTKNKGVVEYALDGKNCIMVNINDPVDMAEKIIQLFKDDMLRNRIISKGLKTASQYTWDCIIPKIISYYQQVAGLTPVKNKIVHA